MDLQLKLNKRKYRSGSLYFSSLTQVKKLSKQRINNVAYKHHQPSKPYKTATNDNKLQKNISTTKILRERENRKSENTLSMLVKYTVMPTNLTNYVP